MECSLLDAVGMKVLGSSVYSRRTSKHVWILWVVMWTSAATPAIAGGSKPLLNGSYEVVRIKNASGPEIDVREASKGQSRLWARVVLTFDGDKLSSTTQGLAPAKHMPGAFEACEALVETIVVWSAKGYTVAQAVNGGAEVTVFSQLDENNEKSVALKCTNSIEAGTYTVVLMKDAVRLDTTEGSLTLKRTELKPNWKAVVRGH
jgi:hypothetical protein